MTIPANQSVSKWAAQWEIISRAEINDDGKPIHYTTRSACLQQLRTKALTESLQTHNTDLLKWAWSPEENTLPPLPILRGILKSTNHIENPGAFQMVNDLLRNEVPATAEEPSAAVPFFEGLAESYKRYAQYVAPQGDLSWVDQMRAGAASAYRFFMNLAETS